MVRRLRSHKLIAVRNRTSTAIVGIRRRALALFAAVGCLLIELAAGKTVEGPRQQKNCQESDANMHTSTHTGLTIPEFFSFGPEGAHL